MNDIIDALLLIFFSAWLIATILGQWNAASHRRERFPWVRRYDRFGLIPTWTFFAPRPATTDIHLLYRDKLAVGAMTPWTEAIVVEPRRFLHIVWNPSKRQRKMVSDTVGALFRDLSVYSSGAKRGKRVGPLRIPKDFHTTWPYLILLHYVSSLSRLPGCAATQFALFRSGGDPEEGGAEPQPVFISALHTL